MRSDGAVHLRLNEEDVRAAGRRLRRLGVDCVAVCFLHAHAWPAHERRAAAILRRVMKGTMVIASSEVYPEFREYERFSTTVLNAALLTVMHAYLDRLEKSVAGLGIPCAPTISQSAGGLMSIAMARDFPIRTALSGPAAGATGAAFRARLAGFPEIITLDVGGNSADVSILTGGRLPAVHSRNLAGFPLRLPALDVNSVGAGGGSIAWIDRDGLLKVGPQSAGAVPGPACYARGGTEATVTDAQVMLGRLAGDALLDGRMPIRRELAADAIASLSRRIHLPPVETATRHRAAGVREYRPGDPLDLGLIAATIRRLSPCSSSVAPDPCTRPKPRASSASSASSSRRIRAFFAPKACSTPIWRPISSALSAWWSIPGLVRRWRGSATAEGRSGSLVRSGKRSPRPRVDSIGAPICATAAKNFELPGRPRPGKCRCARLAVAR